MALGPGIYDDHATRIMRQTRAEGVILLVLRGNLGSGFSAQLTTEGLMGMPEMLRRMADQIENDQKAVVGLQESIGDRHAAPSQEI